MFNRLKQFFQGGKTMMYRQGDVLLIKVDGPFEVDPTRIRQVEFDAGRVVLAYGEVTGHAHAIKVREVADAGDPAKPPVPSARQFDYGAERFLRLVEKSVLEHEEHSPIELDAGLYRVVRQREYDPEEARRARFVAD